MPPCVGTPPPPPPHPLNPGGRHPRLKPKNWDGMDDRNVKTPQHPNIRSLLPQDLIQTRPYIPIRPNIVDDFRPIVVGCRQEASQVLKILHCFQWYVIILEHRHCPYSRLLLIQMPSLPICYPCNDIRLRVAAIHICPGHEDVTGWEEVVGRFPFSKITTVSHMGRCTNCIRRLVRYRIQG